MSKSSELVYTSAPQGLRPGSRGFCTVAMSESMPAGLVGPLESLSAYRHVDGDGPSPVNHMHVQMKVAGRPVNVLTRIAEAPPDYTGRTNKIAHYVVVATGDRAAGGPAAVLRQPGFAIETWDGEVRKISEPKTIPMADSPTRVAQTWAEQTGDAGWAGTVASIFESRTPGPPIYLIYRPEQNAQLLAMVDEAICLLPESKRWNATFSTHTGELPPGVQCRLRCLVAGSPEALALPPSAMTLDLASGNLGSPPPGPLVEAARTGRIAQPETDRPAAVGSAPSPVQPAFPDENVHAAASDPDTIQFPNLPPQSPPGSLPPPIRSEASPSQKGKWILLAIATVLLLCLGGVGIFYLLPSDPNAVVAELNREAGIVNLPEVDVPQELPPETNVQSEPEPDEDMKSVAEAEAVAMEAARKEAEGEKRQSLDKLKELAASILKGKAFLNAEQENSIEKFSTSVKDELKRLEEQTKQLEEISLKPDEDRLAGWIREPEGSEQLTRFVEERKKEIDVLKQHSPLKDFEDQRKRLAKELKAWDKAAKQWESEQEQQPELILEVPDNFEVEQTIQRVRNTAKSHLQKSMTAILTQYEKRSSENQNLVESTESQLEKEKEELADDWKRRRDSHRLLIYFDGDSSRREGKLQIKPMCYLKFDAEKFDAINRLKFDSDTSVRFEEFNSIVEYQGWLMVIRAVDDVTIQILPRSIPQSIGEKYPILKQLRVLADQQEKTFSDSGKPLKNLLKDKSQLIENSLTEKTRVLKENLVERRKKIAEADRDTESLKQQIHKITQEIANIAAAKSVLADFRGNKTVAANTTDELYLDQGGKVIAAFELLQSHTRDQVVKDAMGEHLSNLENLRRNYLNLNDLLTLFDMEVKLVFGKTKQTKIAQSEFEPIETFELFFFPELVYGPPPRE